MGKGLRTFLAYTGGLIGVYLAFTYSAGATADLTGLQNAYVGGVKTLQGR